MSFRHGVFTKNLDSAGGTILENKTSAIAIVGVSYTGPIHTPTLCNNRKDDAQFGEATPDNSIAVSLKLIRDIIEGSVPGSDGSTPIIVVNVYPTGVNEVLDNTWTVNETTGKVAIQRTLVGDLSAIKIKVGTTAVNVAAGGAYVYGTDYTIDRFGNFTDLKGTYKGEDLRFYDGSMFDPGAYLDGPAIVGEENFEDNIRTGVYALDLCYSLFGFKPNILICPFYNTLDPVPATFLQKAVSWGAEYISDADLGLNVATLLGLRATGQLWGSSSPALVPVMPWFPYFNNFINGNIDVPAAPIHAAMRVVTDMVAGWWESPSNREIPVVGKPSVVITCDINDPNSEATMLNAAGITCYRIEYGKGPMTWGNRNALFPSSTDVLCFVNIYRIHNIISRAMEQNFAQKSDRNINQAFIDGRKQVGNNYIKSLVQRGALLPGSYITYRKQDNNSGDLGNGKIVFYRSYMAPTPAEDMTIASTFDITLLGNLK